MKNLIVILVILIASIFTQGCKEEELCLIGSGTVKEYPLGVDDFENVSLIGPVNLRITQAADMEVMVEAEAEIFSALSYEVKNGTLEIGFKENVTCFETDFGVWVNVALPNIKKINSSGVSDIVSIGDLNLAQLTIDVSGTANLDLSGQVTDHTMKVSGVLNAKNFDLLTTNTNIDVSGSGDFEISCDDNLDIDVSGDAKVSYKGIPSITQDVSGTLNLINAN
jgi:hypothetical protein